MGSRQIRVAIYCRVSTQEQSTELQRNELVEFATNREWQIVRLFDEKLSGTTTNRPEFKSLLELARSKKFDVLLVWKLDRIFRSLKDCLNGLHEFHGLGVDFISLKDPGIDMTSPSGKLMLHLLAAFAEFEASLIRSRVTAGVRAKIAKTGRWGPQKRRDDAKILELRGQGLSMQQIADQLEISKTSVVRSLKGGP